MKQACRILGQTVIVATVMAALCLSAAAAAEVRVAYVDLQRAINECNAGKKAKVEFRAEVQRLQSKLQAEQSEVKALRDELQKKGMLMRDDERRHLQDEYASKMRQFQSDFNNDRAALKQKDQEMTGAILSDLVYVVQNVGERDGYTLIMPKSEVLYAMPAVDITQQVIAAYNAHHAPVGSLGGGNGGGAPPLASSRGEKHHHYSLGRSTLRRSTISK